MNPSTTYVSINGYWMIMAIGSKCFAKGQLIGWSIGSHTLGQLGMSKINLGIWLTEIVLQASKNIMATWFGMFPVNNGYLKTIWLPDLTCSLLTMATWFDMFPVNNEIWITLACICHLILSDGHDPSYPHIT